MPDEPDVRVIPEYRGAGALPPPLDLDLDIICPPSSARTGPAPRSASSPRAVKECFLIRDKNVIISISELRKFEDFFW